MNNSLLHVPVFDKLLPSYDYACVATFCTLLNPQTACQTF